MIPKLKPPTLTHWLPTPGSILFTLLIASLLLYTQRADALPGFTSTQSPSAASTTTFPYQGRLTDPNGDPINAAKAMTFRLYNVASGGTALWQEAWPAVQVSNGLFNVLLGSTMPVTPTLFAENNSLWLGITVGTDTEMTPRVQVGSVPFAMSFPDESITTDKIADGAVTQSKMGDQSLVRATNLTDPIIQAGSGQFGATCDYVNVTFLQPYNQTPYIMITQFEGVGGSLDLIITGASPTEFGVLKSTGNCSGLGNFYWMAIGE